MMMCKIRLVLSALALLTMHPAIGRADSDQESIRRAMADLAQAAEQGDVPALNRMFHANLLYSHSNGLLQDKAAAIAGLAKRDHKYEYGDMQTFFYGNTAVVRAAITAQYPVSKNPAAALSVLLVWIKQEDRWQLVARHVTKLSGTAALKGTSAR